MENKETKEKLRKDEAPCYVAWREKPHGPGEAVAVIIPLHPDYELVEVEKLLRTTTFSEETIRYSILELD